MSLRLSCLVLLFGFSAVRAEEPRAVIERAVKAMGGEELLSMKSATAIKVRGIIQPGGGKMPFTGEFLHQSALTRRYDITVDFGGMKIEVAQAVVEGKGWRKMPGGTVMDIPEAEVNDLRELMDQDKASSLLPLLKDADYTLTLLDEIDVSGQPAIGVKAVHKNKTESLLYFHKKTGFLVKMKFTDKKGKQLETILSDYREVARDEDERTLRGAGLEIEARPLLAYLRRQAPDPAKIAQVRVLLRKLGDDSFDVREQAAKDLVALEKVAVPLLQQARKDGDAEVARRAGECLDQIEKRTNDATLLAAVRLVGWTRPEGGAEVLLALLPGVEEVIANEAKAALVVYSERDGKPNAALVKALDDKEPIRRAAAAAVLGKDGGAYLKQPERRLFVRGLMQPMRSKYIENGKESFEFEVVEYRVVNLLDPKRFEKPAP